MLSLLESLRITFYMKQLGTEIFPVNSHSSNFSMPAFEQKI